MWKARKTRRGRSKRKNGEKKEGKFALQEKLLANETPCKSAIPWLILALPSNQSGSSSDQHNSSQRLKASEFQAHRATLSTSTIPLNSQRSVKNRPKTIRKYNKSIWNPAGKGSKQFVSVTSCRFGRQSGEDRKDWFIDAYKIQKLRYPLATATGKDPVDDGATKHRCPDPPTVLSSNLHPRVMTYGHEEYNVKGGDGLVDKQKLPN